jgi:hypothetical protein
MCLASTVNMCMGGMFCWVSTAAKHIPSHPIPYLNVNHQMKFACVCFEKSSESDAH